MDISYDYYRIFYFVGKYKSFSKAAKMLMRNQPNITKVMNKLEQQLGCTLFIRSNRGVTLTREGQKLYERVKIAYKQISQAEQELQKDTGLENGIVSIGTTEMALHGVLLPVLRAFHKAHPGVKIHLSNYTTPQALQALKQGLVDFSVVISPIEMNKEYKITEIYSFHEILAAGTEYFSGKNVPVSLCELASYPIISHSEESATHELYNEVFQKNGLEFHPDIQVATSDQLIPLIENDLGVGFLPEFMAEQPLKQKRIRKLSLKEALPERKICLVEGQGKTLSIAAEAMKKNILACAPKLD